MSVLLAAQCHCAPVNSNVMPYCPNCAAEVRPDSPTCARCSADFGVNSTWEPIDRLPDWYYQWRWTRVLVIYGLVGPPLGAVLFALVLIPLNALWSSPLAAITNFPSLLSKTALMALVFMWGCFQLGGIAALSAAVAHLYLRRRVVRVSSILLIVPLVAATAQASFLWAIQTPKDFSEMALTLSLVAATASAFVAFIVQVCESRNRAVKRGPGAAAAYLQH